MSIDVVVGVLVVVVVVVVWPDDENLARLDTAGRSKVDRSWSPPTGSCQTCQSRYVCNNDLSVLILQIAPGNLWNATEQGPRPMLWLDRL